ncbi:MAG: heavy metal translocating P-type ATPase [Methanobacteriaceae archaeon]|nr:heavy metal translocating P-type ATPase [Methanobacteriaceae archaeon]
MKYKITYDNNKDRIRLRCGKYAFNKEEEYGLINHILENKNVIDTKVSSINGSILIKYTKNKEKILNYISLTTINDLKNTTPREIDITRNINNTYINKMISLITKRVILKYLLPTPLQPINYIKTIFESYSYIKDALKSLYNFKLDVAVLDGVAIFGSLINKMFQSAGSIIFFLKISDILEEYTIEKTNNALKNSLEINIDKVWIQTENKEEIQIPFTQLKPDHKIILRTGSIIPVDGTIISGEAEINEATMTGESLPVSKGKKKKVFAGTLIDNGEIIVNVEAINEKTRINQIIELIEKSEKTKASIQSKAEKLADSIVPFNFLLTLLTYIFTQNKIKTLSVLTVDYSCAIKLATPLSIISAMKEASDHQIVIKGGKYLEAYAQADTIIFDKTGTLTEASPKVKRVISCGQYKPKEILRLSACLEEHFPHSVAKSIVNKAKEENLDHINEEHEKVEYIVAHGIVSSIYNKRVVIGSRHFILEDENVQVTKEQDYIIEQNREKYSIIYLAIDSKLEGIICIDDPPRKEAKKVLNQLRQLGIKNIVMLTGDSENSSRAVAEELEITKYKSQLLPEQKSEIIEEIKKKTNKVIMVGDGINDSPALSCADVSIAMKDSSDIAQEVADITLLNPNLNELVTLRTLSQLMLKKIDKNYIKIVSINTLLILLGITGIITPSQSSLGHNASTLLIGISSSKTCLDKQEIEI